MSENEEEEELESLAEAFAGPRRGVSEDLVIKGLLDSVTAPPLRNILLTTETGLRVPREQAEKLGLDQELLKKLHTLADSLANVVTRKNHPNGPEVFKVPWGFPQTRENFEAYIRPWYRGSIYYYPDMLQYSRKAYITLICGRCGREMDSIPKGAPQAEMEAFREKWKLDRYLFFDKPRCPHCGYESDFSSSHFGHRKEERTRVMENPEHTFFFDCTTNALSQLGYELIKTAFTSWAIPINQQLSSLITQTVSETRFRELLEFYIKRERKEREQPAE